MLSPLCVRTGRPPRAGRVPPSLSPASRLSCAGSRTWRKTQDNMSRQRILVVEDDSSTQRFLSDLLVSRGYEVECAASGEEAMSRISSGDSPALALLDLLLPGMQGLEVLERIKQSDAALPVIILSCVGQTKTVVDAMKSGASDYLVKPFEEHELELAIENALEKQRLRDEVKSLRRQLDQYEDRIEFNSTNPKILRLKEI